MHSWKQPLLGHPGSGAVMLELDDLNRILGITSYSYPIP